MGCTLARMTNLQPDDDAAEGVWIVQEHGEAIVWNLSSTGRSIHRKAAELGIDPAKLPPGDRRCFLRVSRKTVEKCIPKDAPFQGLAELQGNE